MKTTGRRIAVPVQTGTGATIGQASGHVVYEADGTLAGFVRDDAMRTRLDRIIGDHVLLRPLTISVAQYRQCCLMPGVGYVER